MYVLAEKFQKLGNRISGISRFWKIQKLEIRGCLISSPIYHVIWARMKRDLRTTSIFPTSVWSSTSLPSTLSLISVSERRITTAAAHHDALLTADTAIAPLLCLNHLCAVPVSGLPSAVAIYIRSDGDMHTRRLPTNGEVVN